MKRRNFTKLSIIPQHTHLMAIREDVTTIERIFGTTLIEEYVTPRLSWEEIWRNRRRGFLLAPHVENHGTKSGTFSYIFRSSTANEKLGYRRCGCFINRWQGTFLFRLTFTWSFSVHKIVIELSVNVQLRSTPELTNMDGLNCEYVT